MLFFVQIHGSQGAHLICTCSISIQGKLRLSYSRSIGGQLLDKKPVFDVGHVDVGGEHPAPFIAVLHPPGVGAVGLCHTGRGGVIEGQCILGLCLLLLTQHIIVGGDLSRKVGSRNFEHAAGVCHCHKVIVPILCLFQLGQQLCYPVLTGRRGLRRVPTVCGIAGHQTPQVGFRGFFRPHVGGAPQHHGKEGAPLFQLCALSCARCNRTVHHNGGIGVGVGSGVPVIVTQKQHFSTDVHQIELHISRRTVALRLD